MNLFVFSDPLKGDLFNISPDFKDAVVLHHISALVTEAVFVEHVNQAVSDLRQFKLPVTVGGILGILLSHQGYTLVSDNSEPTETIVRSKEPRKNKGIAGLLYTIVGRDKEVDEICNKLSIKTKDYQKVASTDEKLLALVDIVDLSSLLLIKVESEKYLFRDQLKGLREERLEEDGSFTSLVDSVFRVQRI